MKPLFPSILFGSGKILLLGSSSIHFLITLQRNESFEKAFLRFAVATILFFFFVPFLNSLLSLSNELTHFFEGLGSRDGLKELILNSFKRASQQSNPGFSVVEQIWRTGVWGVVSVLAECFFLLSSLLLEIGREITLQLIWILYPLMIGIAPLFPNVTSQFILHVFSVALWWPIFTLITVVTSVIARNYMAHTDSWGLSILALEVMACLMTCAVPAISQRLISGAVSQTAQHLSVTSFQNSISTNIKNSSLGGEQSA